MLLVVVWKTVEWPHSGFGHMELCHPMDEAQFIGQTLSHDVLCVPLESVVVHLLAGSWALKLLAGAESENQSLQGWVWLVKMEEPPQTSSRVPLASQPCPPSTCFTRVGTCSSRACTCSSCACTCCSRASFMAKREVYQLPTSTFKPVVSHPAPSNKNVKRHLNLV